MGKHTTEDLAKFEAAFQIYLDAYMTGRNLESLKEMVTDDFCGYGTGLDETFYSKYRGLEIFQRDITSAPNPLHYTLHHYEIKLLDPNNAIVVSEMDLATEIMEQQLRLNSLRMMMVLHEEDGIVKISGLHISFPTNVHAENEFYPQKDWEARGQLLNCMVEEKTKSLQQSVAECKQAEEVLQESEEILSSILNNMNDVVWSVLWPPKGKLAFISPSVKKVFGYTPQEVSQDPILWERIVHPDDRYKFDNIVKVMEQNKTQDFEFRAVKPDGSIVWIYGRFYLVHDNNGNALRLDGRLTDITKRKKIEDSLKVSEEKYHAIMGQSAEMLYLHGLDGKILDVNQAAAAQTGYTKDELLTMKVFDLHSDELDRADIIRQWKEWTVGQSENLEIIHRCKNGNNMPVEVTTGKICFGGEEYILAFIRDISRRKKAESDLTKEYQLRTALLDNIPGCISMILKQDSHKIVAANSAARKIGALPGQTCFRTWVGRKDNCSFCLAYKLRETGKMQKLEEMYGGKWYDVVWAPLTEDLFVHYFFDITERKQAEKKIADYNMELEQLYDHLDKELERCRPLYEQTRPQPERTQHELGCPSACQSAHSPDSNTNSFAVSADTQSTDHEHNRLNAITLAHITNGVVLIDEQEAVQLINRGFTKITGFKEKDIKGSSINIVFEGLDLAALKNDKHFCENNFHKIQAWYQHNNGEYYYAVIVISAIKDEHSLQQQYLLVFQDITEEEKLKIEQDKLHQKLTRMSNLISINALLAGVIHDITQPVNAISIIAESIHYRLEQGMHVAQNKLIHDFENVYKQANNLGTVLNKVRSYELFSLSEAKLDISINEVVQNILAMLERQLLSHGIKVELKLDRSLPAFRAYHNSLEQIVLHLVTNAIQAFEQGDSEQKDRRLTILSYAKQEGMVTLEINDNAGGIPENILNQLFEPFVTTKSSNKGMGLGLYIVHSLVSGLHGTIIALNNKQNGVTFWLEFPANDK